MKPGFSKVPYMIFPLVLLFLTVGEAGAAGFSKGPGNMITDQGGRSLVPEKPFSRIISLYGAHTENLRQLGAAGRIIGVVKNENEDDKKELFSYRDDPEKFLAARPDLVLVRPMIERGYGPLIRRLTRSGITVLSLQPGNVEEMYVYWKILGLLTGEEGNAEGLIENFKKALSGYSVMTRGIKEKKRVYFEAIHTRMRTFTPGSMAVFALEAAGGVNAAGDARGRRGTNIADYGKERILSKARMIDVFLAQSGVMNAVSVKMIKEEPGFGMIKGVKDGEVYLVDEMVVSRPSFRLLNGIFRIGNILYPEIFDEEAARELEREVNGLKLETIGAAESREPGRGLSKDS